MSKIDLKKELKYLYRPSTKEVGIVDVPPMNYLMIDGRGDPNTSQDYQDAMESLYGVCYTLKFMIKKGESAVDYVVMPLEGLWWTDNMDHFSTENKTAWNWTSMIVQPDVVTEELYEEARKELERKKNPPGLSQLRFESYHEGLSVQIMHIGPFSAEGPTIERMHHFIEENSYQRAGKHHEIYLSDPRRTAPEKLKTVLRQPVRRSV